MRLIPSFLRWGKTKANMAALTSIPTAESVMESHDGGPDWEGREKASFESRHGGNIWYRRWSPQSRAVAILFIAHGLHSHGGRWSKVAHHYTDKGFIVFANDHVGHGLTVAALEGDESARGLVTDYRHMTDDFSQMVEEMVNKEEDKSLPIYILGHSMGSLVATVAAKTCLENPTVGTRFKKLVLSGCPIVPGPGSASPFGLRVLYPINRKPQLVKSLAGLMARLDPGGPAAPVDQDSLSADPEVALEAKVDPLMIKGSTKNKTAYEVTKLIQAARENACKVSVPTLLIHGADDDIAYPSGSVEMKSLLTASSAVELEVYDGVRHEVLKHKDKFQTVVAAVDKHWDCPS